MYFSISMVYPALRIQNAYEFSSNVAPSYNVTISAPVFSHCTVI